MVELGKRPRHWAYEIMALETKEERKKALSKAPQEWHELIRAHARTIKNPIKGLNYLSVASYE